MDDRFSCMPEQKLFKVSVNKPINDVIKQLADYNYAVGGDCKFFLSQPVFETIKGNSHYDLIDEGGFCTFYPNNSNMHFKLNIYTGREDVPEEQPRAWFPVRSIMSGNIKWNAEHGITVRDPRYEVYVTF